MVRFKVVLVEPKYQGNIGSVARVMKNFGFNDLILVNPPRIEGEARAMSMHALDVLENATVVENLRDVDRYCDFKVSTSAITAGDSNALRSPVFPEELAKALDSDGNIGIVFGREDYGLYNEEVLECDMQVTIPANQEYPTLNLAQSVAVILYELSRSEHRKRAGKRKFRELDGERKRVLYEMVDGMVDEVFDDDWTRELNKKSMKQVFGRAFVSGREAQTLIGLFRNAGEKLSGKTSTRKKSEE
ncbi:MAG TPA: RNA methyltransferase [Candidatus Altiarchaeales archaeon]|nr:RNA methyltransferase [Candidatus Altiarchaeales archaeon]